MTILLSGVASAQSKKFHDAWIESRGHFSKPFRFTADESLVQWTRFLIWDVDADGDLDILGISNLGVFVRRGEEVPGRFGPLEIQEGSKGAADLMLAHEGEGTFWVRWDAGEQADLVSWKDEKWAVLRSERIRNDELWAVWEGWIVHGPDAEGRLLASNGSQTITWIESVGDLARLEVMDVEGEGRLDLILTLEDGRVGWLANGPEEGGAIEWIHGAEDFQGAWTFFESGEEVVQILGKVQGQNVVLKRMGSGEWVRAASDWESKILPQSETWRHRLNSEQWLVFSHDVIAHSAYITIWSESKQIHVANSSEAPTVRTVQVVDFNADGIDDVVYLDEEERELVCVYRLRSPDRIRQDSVEMQWPWRGVYPDGVAVGEGGKLPFWNGIDQTNYLDLRDQTSDEQIIHNLAIAGGKIQGQLDEGAFEMRRSEAIGNYLNRDLAIENLKGNQGTWLSELGEVGVYWPHVEHFPEQGLDRRSHFGKVSLNEWHHFAFSRDENLRVRGYIDGECVMKGYSSDLRFDHRRILIGATYGTNWNGFFRGRLDEVEFSNKVYSDEEVKMRFEAKQLIRDSWTQACISFESEEGKIAESVSGRQIQLSGGWSLVDGVSGQAIRFNGVDGRGFVHSDLAEKNMSLSYWAYVEAEPDPTYKPTSTAIAAYGMYNNNHVFLDIPSDRGPAEVLVGLDVERLSVPDGEVGCRFDGNGLTFFLSSKGQIYVGAERTWQKASTSGVAPSADNPVRCHWVEAERLHVISNDGRHYMLDLELMKWTEKGTLHSDVNAAGACVLPTAGGIAFVGKQNNALQGWWKPKTKSSLMPLIAPQQTLQRDDEWVGMESHWGILHWVSRKGRTEAVQLDELAEELSLYNGFGVTWTATALAAIALLGFWKFRPRRREAQVETPDTERVRDEDLRMVLERLKAEAPVTLDSNGIDELLGLGGVISGETRRSQRARLIRLCNDWAVSKSGQPVIRRRKDATDRRRTLYYVNFELLDDSFSFDESESIGNP